jgi:DNA replication protein DnaC
MDNKEPISQLHQTGNHIGKTEYYRLLNKENPTDQELISIQLYEELQIKIEEGKQKSKKYLQSLVDKDFSAPELNFTAEQLYKAYAKVFHQIIGKEFPKEDKESLDNILPLIFYFSKDERFFSGERLHKISNPSFKKGLLIIGNYGNGKTTAMFILEKIFKGISGKTFKGYTTNDIVVMYEACDNDSKILEFDKTMKAGNRYFDDLCSERHASRFGKVNVMKEVLENRYIKMKDDQENPIKTFCTMNFDEEYPNDIEKAIEYIGTKYGSRIYDRVFEMFNVVEFKGKSFRR